MADDNDTARAERLTALFERSGFTRQKDLAEAIDVETRTVQRWLAGEGIAKRYWDDLAAALDTNVRFLIWGETEPDRLDESQLDRIEAKLDDILSQLAARELPAAWEQAIAQAATQATSSAAKPPRRAEKRKAS